MTTQRDPFVILLAEDSPSDVGLVREVLNEHSVNCTLYVVKDGAQAISFIEEFDQDPREPRLDLLLLDLHLPKHDGKDILETLRSTERCAQTAVIVMTGSDSPEDHETAQKHAAAYYFRKPLSFAQFMELGSVVKEILAKQDPAARKEAV